MTHSAADVVRFLLIDIGQGTNPGDSAAWPVFASGEPGDPDQVVTTYDTAGVQHGRTMTDGAVQEHLGFQVRVRSKDHKTGWRKTHQIRAAMAEGVYQRAVTVPAGGGDPAAEYLVHCVSKLGPVLALGKESPTSKRSLFTVNAVLSVKQLP